MRNGAQVVDAHVHIGSFSVVENLQGAIETKEDLFGFRTKYADTWNSQYDAEPYDNTPNLIKTMDRYGVDKAVVMARPGAADSFVVEMASAFPDRLRPAIRLISEQELFGYVKDPAPIREKAPEVIRHFVKEHNICAVSEVFIRGLTNEVHPERIADDFDPIMTTLSEVGIPISFPTAWSQWKGGLHYGDPLWVDEVAGRHPDVPIVLCKMGRGFVGPFENALMVAVRNNNVYFDLVQTTSEHLRRAVDAIGAHRILFGTDWDVLSSYVCRPYDVHEWSLSIIEGAGLTEEEEAQILGLNSMRLFGLDQPDGTPGQQD